MITNKYIVAFLPPDAVVRSSVFFFGSGVLLVSGYACCMVGLCHKQKRVCTFVAGALYVVSGNPTNSKLKSLAFIRCFYSIIYTSIYLNAYNINYIEYIFNLKKKIIDYWIKFNCNIQVVLL